MDWNRVEGNWKQIEGKIKAKWGKLTDDDLTAIKGRREQLEGKIQERYGLTKDQARREIEDWYHSTKSHLADQIEAISTFANTQIARAQDRVVKAEDAITRNPLSAVAIAAGLGFLVGAFTRR